MSKYLKHVTKPAETTIPLSQPLPGRTDQVKNSTGSFVFALDSFSRLERFLILGAEGGTYYASEKALTLQNVTCIDECVRADAVRTVQTIVEISDQGRAIKNDTCVFALALVASSGNPEAAKLAFANLNKVCRIGTHLFQFVAACNELRGWGRALREAVAGWYNSRSAEALARQVTKYAQRDGWSHRDVLRLSHAVPVNPGIQEVFQYVCKNDNWQADEDRSNKLLHAVAEVKAGVTESRLVKLIEQAGLEREHIPTEHLNSVKVWEALLPNLKQTALIRNLGKLSSIGIIKPLSKHGREIADRIADEEALKQGRVHPFSILLALKTYESGHGLRGDLSWTVDPRITTALESAYYLAFAAVEPTGKNFLFGIDVSGSMTAAMINNTNVSARSAAACLAMVSMRTEPNTYAFGFCHQFVDLNINASMDLATVERNVHKSNFGSTDCSLPMTHALKHKLEVDTFVVITDNETNSGQHPTAALNNYRQKMGRNARLIVVGMTATGFTIADPKDPLQLDIVGFDSTGPQVISEFSR